MHKYHGRTRGLIPVILESPYRGDRARNLAYARAAVADCLAHGFAALGSHLYWPQLLDDDVPAERALGMAAGAAWWSQADLVVVYRDFGITGGMAWAIARHRADGRAIWHRCLAVNDPFWTDFPRPSGQRG